MLDSRIDNEIAELKRSQTASLDAFKAELRGEVGNQIWKYIRHIDETKAGIEEVRSKVKEIIDYEGHCLPWLIRGLHHLVPGRSNSHLFDHDTPKLPTQLNAFRTSGDPRLPQHPLPQNPRDAFLSTSNASCYAAAAAAKK